MGFLSMSSIVWVSSQEVSTHELMIKMKMKIFFFEYSRVILSLTCGAKRGSQPEVDAPLAQNR